MDYGNGAVFRAKQNDQATELYVKRYTAKMKSIQRPFANNCFPQQYQVADNKLCDTTTEQQFGSEIKCAPAHTPEFMVAVCGMILAVVALTTVFLGGISK
jgi:hypothetical protein